MSHILAKANALDWQRVKEQGHASEGRQPRRIWAVEALKPELTEQEYEAAQRAVRECILHFPGAGAKLDRVDMGWSDAGMAKRVDAARALYGLRQGVMVRSRAWDGASSALAPQAANGAEWLVQQYTLRDVAYSAGLTCAKGKDRQDEPDLKRTRPFVRLVLCAMADYYDACDRGAENWRGRA